MNKSRNEVTRKRRGNNTKSEGISNRMDSVILLVSQAQSHLTSILLTCRHRFLLCPTTYLGGKVNRAHAISNPDSPDRTAGTKTFQASTSRAPIQFSLILQVTLISTISV